MPQTADNIAPPLSRRLTVAEVPPEGLDVEIVANSAEREALARLNGLPEVSSFTASLKARRWRGNGIEVTGEIRAQARQTCVVTLDDFDTEIVEPVDVRFAPPKDEPPHSRRRRADEDEPAHELSMEDEPDPLVGGAVDLGAAASEFFTLALDPYPRKPGAEFVEPAPETPGTVSPFAVLGAHKGKPGAR